MRNRSIWNLIIIISIIVIALSCIDSGSKTDTKTITVSILPQKYFVDRITGSTFEVNVMVPPGASPATYEPTARQMKQLGSSLIYLKIGYIEFEKIWIKKIKSTNIEIKIFDISKDVELIETTKFDHGDHHHGSIDPHVWMSPKMVKNIAKNILDALTELYPDLTIDFTRNYNDFIAEINKIDIKTSASLKNLKNREFLIFHPALTYYARDYDLEQIPIQLEGKDPSPAHFKEIINNALENDIRIIFIQEQFDTENAKVIADEINAKVIQINPLDYNWPKQIELITQSLIQYNKK